MTWICSKCKHSNPNVGEYCYFCIHHVGIKVLKSGQDFYDDSEHHEILFEIYKTEKAESLDFHHFDYVKNWRIPVAEMSAKEKLFADFFNNEKGLVKNMDDMKLKAHIEELQDIAFQARARLSAADDEARERAATKKKQKGFQASVQTDDFTSNAINNINERAKKMSKQEKEIERLVGMGMDRKDAENLYKPATVLTVKNQGAKAVLEDNGVNVKNIIDSVVNATPEQKKNFSNPFGPKVVEEEVKPPVNSALNAAIDSILNLTATEPKEPAKALSNPFASSPVVTPPNLPVEIPQEPLPVQEPVKEVEGLDKPVIATAEEPKKPFNPFAK